MSNVLIEKERCKGCELCINACPQKVLGISKELNIKGYFVAKVVEGSRCIGCRICAVTCPDCAIEIRAEGVQYSFFEY